MNLSNNSSNHPVFVKNLNNGITILLKEIHTVPLISQWIWYRAGSRNEEPGKTGISHFVEHIQFKGTPKYPIKVLDHAISRDGGIWNAMTYLDWTTYFETMPANKIDLALELEVDRMTNSRFDNDDIETERAVVISEREGNENEPLFRLSEAVQKAAFNSHPYHHEVIGELEDLKSITREDMYSYYRSHYNPANTVISIAGNFESGEMLKRLSELYKDIPSQPLSDYFIFKEPDQTEEKHVVVEGPGETVYLNIAYHAPSGRDRDFFVLTILDSILTGPTSLNMFGGGSISNKTSRLYQRLVEKDLAVSISGGLQATIDPYLFEISTTVHPEHSVDEIIAAIDDEIAHIIEHQVTNEEIAKAIKQSKALFAYGSENITNQAFWMGYANMYADYSWFENFIRSIETVSADEILGAAQKYLIPKNRVVGIYQPNNASKQ